MTVNHNADANPKCYPRAW